MRRDALVAAALSLATTLPLLAVPSYWQDEAATLSAARRSPGELVDLLHRTDVVHGAYYFLMHWWVALVGDAEFWVRLPSALALAITVGLVALVGGRLWGRTAGAVAAGVAVLLPTLSWLGLDARPSASATLCTTAALTLVLCGEGRRGLLGAAAWWLAGIAFQLTAVLHLPAWVYSARLRFGTRWTVAAAALVVVLAVPLAIAAGHQSAQISWVDPSTAGALGAALVTAPADGAHSDLLGAAGPVLVGVVAAVLLAVSIAYGVLLRDVRLLLWAYGAGTLAALANLVGVHVYLSRYFATAAPAFALMAGAVVARVAAQRRGRRLPVVATALFVAATVPLWIAQRTSTGHYDENLRSDARVLAGRPGATVVYVDASARSVAEAYPDAVRGRPQFPAPGSERAAGTLWGPQVAPTRLAAVGGTTTELLLVASARSHRLPGALVVVRRAGCRVVERHREHRLQVVRLRCG